MANKRQWSRYQPPAEKRNEQGQRTTPTPTTPTTPSPKASSRKAPGSPSKPKQKSSTRVVPPKASPKQTAKPPFGGWIGGLSVLVFVLVVIVSISVAVKAGNTGDDSSNPDLDTSLLNEEFIGGSLAEALEVEGNDAVSVHLDEYGMTIEYFDPNTRETRSFETNDYIDGYTLRVQESFYEDYQPRPFDLSLVDASSMIAAVEDAVTRTDDAYRFELRIEADRESGEVTMVVRVTGDESVEVTVAP